jgi:KipI family sensor histidine kinase inhibitor
VTGPTSGVGRLGDGAVLADLAGDLGAAHRLAALSGTARLSGRWPAVEEVIVGFGTVTVVVDPLRVGLDSLLDEVSDLAAAALAGEGDEAVASPGAGGGVVEIPVRFDGPDLEELSKELGQAPPELVAELAACQLRVAFVGFSPGFAYLVDLPPALAAVPRRSRPRPVVPAGSVGLGGGFAGVYPQATPGGWHLVGRTSAVLFDPGRPPYASLSPGQLVRLCPTTDELEPPPPVARPPLRAEGGPALTVEEPGACSLVQDLGRRGVAALGVPKAGAADPLSLRLANRLLGNHEDGAALEVTGRGPRLRATAALHVAVVGDLERPGRVDVRVDGRPAPEGQVVPLSDGQVLEVGDVAKVARALVGVSGGFHVPSVLGSQSSDLLCGLGPGPLRAGDELALGPAHRPRARLRFPGGDDSPATLRVLPGPDVPSGPGIADGPEWAASALAGEWRVDSQSNRVGLRLLPSVEERHRVGSLLMPPVPSRGMVTGAVQWPPGGELVVLGPDHATVGGYPVVAVVCSADLFRLAHLPPGSAVRFAVVDQAEAAAALARREASVRSGVEGWFPTRAG